MINVPDTKDDGRELIEFSIEFTKKDACFRGGDCLLGQLNVKTANSQFHIESIRVALLGVARLRPNTMASKETGSSDDRIYLKREWFVVNPPGVDIHEPHKIYAFQETLPEGLPTSLEGKSGRIIYTIRATMNYVTGRGYPKVVTAIRGFCTVEEIDLNLLPAHHFEELSINQIAKFGCFSCTGGGQIRLSLLIERTAFVCGESFGITGRIENRTDRRVDKVSAQLLQRVKYGCEDLLPSSSAARAVGAIDTSTWETQEINEDSMALFVDPGANIKIDRKYSVPAVPPSTPMDWIFQEQVAPRPQNGRLSMSNARLSIAQTLKRRQSSTVSAVSTKSTSKPSRIIIIAYVIRIRVRSGNADVIDVEVPVVIGTVPLNPSADESRELDPSSLTKLSNGVCGHQDTALYRQCKIDRPVQLIDHREETACSKAQLSYINKYPFYADLPTSSKQNKKLGVMLNAVRADARFKGQMIKHNEENKATSAFVAAVKSEPEKSDTETLTARDTCDDAVVNPP